MGYIAMSTRLAAKKNMTVLLPVRPPVFPLVDRSVAPVNPSVRPIGRSVRPSFICQVGRSGPSTCLSGRSVYL